MYANNTVMHFNTTDSHVIADTLTNELTLVNNWLIDKNLFMHKGKTECMLFGTGHRLTLSTSFSVAIDGKALNRARVAMPHLEVFELAWRPMSIPFSYQK